jgi:two-component system sensor histidine kinase RegB
VDSTGNATQPDLADRAEISLDWLVRLRWGAVLGETLTVAVSVAVLGPGLPLARLTGLIAILAASNLLLTAVRRRVSAARGLCGAALSLDVLLLSALLYATGGPNNPFSVLYLVYITLAAVVLGVWWTWFVAALSIGGYALLFAAHMPMKYLDHHGPEMSLHLQGMWVAFIVAAILTASFVVKLSSAIDRRDAALAKMREREARHARLAAVTTLAAGAAHELGTPLATIAVAAKELERAIRSLPSDHAGALLDDAALIRSELERCRAILSQLATGTGQMPGEAPEELRADDLLAAIVDALPVAERRRLEPAARGNGNVVRLPRAPLVQLTLNLLRNAFDAADGGVALSVEGSVAGLCIRVHDDGPGMAPELLARVGEPFFSTKPTGAGLGLGVFIARTLAEQMGGSLALDSSPGHGTTALVQIGGVARRPLENDAR